MKNSFMVESLTKKIGGEIIISNNPGKALKKWRELMKIPQKDLADYLGISSSVISDYESGRRKSPGIKMIQKIINAMIELEMQRGGKIINQFLRESGSIVNVILDIREFIEPISIEKILKVTNSKLIIGNKSRKIYGYTIIDSLKAIVNYPPSELVKLYGTTTERVMIFTKVSSGRSPMVAIKVAGLKPPLVILHGTNKVDELAKKIAEVEGITLAVSHELNVESLILKLRKLI